MLLADEPALAGWTWTIVATDLDDEALAGARLGLYGERAVAQVPPELLARWFTRRGKLFELDAGLRARIDYQTPQPRPRAVRAAVRRVRPGADAQRPDLLPPPAPALGGLPGGPAPGARGLPLPRRLGDPLADPGRAGVGRPRPLLRLPPPQGPARRRARRRSVRRRGASRRRSPSRPPRSARAGPIPTRAPGASRAAAVAPAPPTPAAPTAGSPPRRIPPPGACWPPPATSPPTASRTPAGPCEAALAADPSEPAAHALQGFLHDLCGRTEEAIPAYRAALYLDPALFQVRVLLADCLLRLGNRDRAEHQFREVLTLLASGRERPLRALRGAAAAGPRPRAAALPAGAEGGVDGRPLSSWDRRRPAGSNSAFN